MIILLTILHLLVCVFLILVVLLQTGKGADVAAAFGGTSQTAFGARGATTLLSKLTTGSAIIFMITSFTLAMLANRGGRTVVPAEAPQQSAPPVPAPPAPQAPDSGGQPVEQAPPGLQTPPGEQAPAPGSAPVEPPPGSPQQP